MAQKNIGLLIKHINLEYVRLVDTRLSVYGVSTVQGEALYHISLDEGLSQTQLRHHLGITAPSLSVLIDSLVSKGFVVRHSDPVDPRRLKLFLTPQAKPVVEKFAAIKRGIYAEFHKDMSEAQLALFGEWLQQFLDSLKQQSNPSDN